MTKVERRQIPVEKQVEEPDAAEAIELEVEGESEGEADLISAVEAEPEGEAASKEKADVETEEKVAPPKEELKVDELTALHEQLAEVQAKADEYLDGWQRARAEFVNYRRREEQRRKQMGVEAKSRVLANLLPVLDDLDRAFEAIPQDARNSPWGEGLSLVEHKLQAVLEKNGLSVMPVKPGDVFDPNYHEAVTHEPSKDFDEGQIIQVAQQGYKLDDIILRPTLVRVSNGKVDEGEQDS